MQNQIAGALNTAMQGVAANMSNAMQVDQERRAPLSSMPTHRKAVSHRCVNAKGNASNV